MPEKKTKYIIVGGGLAGTLLSRMIKIYGQEFILVDKPSN
jgi:UDP-galactopyranose mutase